MSDIAHQSAGFTIKDSGTRRGFGTGSVRDAATGKGRMDLMPVFAMEDLLRFVLERSETYSRWVARQAHISFRSRLHVAAWGCLNRAIRGDAQDFLLASAYFTLWSMDLEEKGNRGANVERLDGNGDPYIWRAMPWDGLIRLSRLYEAGCLKYGDRNWELGQPLHIYLDSASRHLAKCLAGWSDEDHLTASAWNQMCCIETIFRIRTKTLPASLGDSLATFPKRIDETPEDASPWFQNRGVAERPN